MNENVPEGSATAQDAAQHQDGVEVPNPEDELLQETMQDAIEFLEGLLDAMQVDGEVSASVSEEGVLQVSIEGSDGGLLIGRRGRTLDAAQELLRAAVQPPGKRVRMALDVDGYRQRRREAIETQIAEALERVDEEGEVELETMSAYERKIAHDIVAETEGVTTFSEGEEPNRRIVIRKEQIQ